MSDARIEKLVNLLARGRALQFENTTTLVARATGRHAGLHAPPLVDFVYRAVQIIDAFLFIEDRGYLAEGAYDVFTDAVFHRVGGKNTVRLKGLVDTYAQQLVDEKTFARVVAADLAAALGHERHVVLTKSLEGTTTSLKRLSQLYAAMTFEDRAMVQALS